MNTLSHKIRFGRCDSKAKTSSGQTMMIKVKDVKEFIRELKQTQIDLRKVGLSYNDGVKAWAVMNKFIDKCAGDKLI